MLGLLGYVAYTSVTNWLNLDRAPSLIRATSEPLTNFVSLLQAERRAAVVYLSQPSAANLGAYQAAITTTKNGLRALDGALNSAATRDNATPSETAALGKMVTDLNGMGTLRAAVSAAKLPPLDALGAYTKIITDQDTVFQAEANSLTNATAATEGLGLISAVNAREDLGEQDAVLAGALASGSLTGPDHVAFGQAAGRQQDDTLLYQALLSPTQLATYNSSFNARVPAALQNKLTTVQQAVEAGTPLREIELGGLSPAAWQQLTKTWANANYQAATDAANSVLVADTVISDSAKNRVWETAGFGAAGLILTLIVSILLGRSINRRLSLLRRSALTLAEEQLPAVVSRLRRGESVDVAAEAPPLRAGSDEIGQVGQAIDTVRQTAIRSAVEESRLRQGVNDMFRNLARRSQSLLQRQLTVLDGMERKATDPDVLEDLFKMDHLTTRMRRHAEGLIILSGAPPGRGWSEPVKLIDVMRGAVSEVEDYARVTVSTQSRAALAGSAVTDVIHLLAELIENATTLSPPFTQVRVSGETVATGFAIEIEDRGLGMTPQRRAELNERLASPPEINPTNTEQLGLFVVGQLARRHGIGVLLRPSPYGGTAAIALIPERLIVDDERAAITAGPAATSAANGGYAVNGAGDAYSANGAAAYAENGGYPHNGGYAQDAAYASAAEAGPGPRPYRQPYGADGPGVPTPGFSPFRAAGRWQDPRNAPSGYPGNGGYRGNGGYGGYVEPTTRYVEPTAAQGPGNWQEPGNWPGPAGRQGPGGWQGAGPESSGGWQGPVDPEGPGGWAGPGPQASQGPQGPQGPQGTGRPPIRISGALRQQGGAGAGIPAGDSAGLSGTVPGASRGRHGTADVPVVTGVPVPPDSAPEAEPFDVFTPLHRGTSGGPNGPGGPNDPGAPGGPGGPAGPGAPGAAQAPYGVAYGMPPTVRQPAVQPPAVQPPSIVEPASVEPASTVEQASAVEPADGDWNGDSAADQPGDPGAGSEDYKGLPRRVRQASLAPQLRANAQPGPAGGTGVPQAAAASLTDMRNTLSAMQRGWQQGRSQGQQDTEGMGDGD